MDGTADQQTTRQKQRVSEDYVYSLDTENEEDTDQGAVTQMASSVVRYLVMILAERWRLKYETRFSLLVLVCGASSNPIARLFFFFFLI